MINYFEKLKQLVSTGELEILYIISPPRTLSTVFEIALSEYGNGQIHEPFHQRRRKDFNDGCRIVYERIIQLQQQFKNQPAKIVIKDLSKFIGPEEWEQLVNLANRFIFVIREPSGQIFSMASRYANDLDDYDVDKLNYQQILANLPRIPFEDLALNYWENLLRLLNITEEYLIKSMNEPRQKYLAIISSITFRYDPLDSIKKLLKHFNLDIDPVKILKDWKVGSGENFFRPKYIVNDTDKDKEFRKGAWLGYAINSCSFDSLDPKHDAPKDIDIYDDQLQNYFLTNILPVFIEMYLNKNNICKPNADFVLSESFIESTLPKSNPIESYLLCKSFLPKNKNQKKNQKQNCLRLKLVIENKYPYISKKFFDLVEIKENVVK